MTDKELLERAAEAAGFYWNEYDADFGLGNCSKHGNDWWNPLADDSDALRLAVKLNIAVDWKIKIQGNQLQVWCGDHARVDLYEPVNADPCAATRRAIVRAAAEIGKELE